MASYIWLDIFIIFKYEKEISILAILMQHKIKKKDERIT